ncbi:MAG: hypothetical protein KAR42_17565 [candidate division Zixibacteria bacterium]|nr:hypothetical protein [candidate division Zixibacteria bacterium]
MSKPIKLPEMIDGTATVEIIKGEMMNQFSVGGNTPALHFKITLSPELENQLMEFYPDAPIRYLHIVGVWDGLIQLRE